MCARRFILNTELTVGRVVRLGCSERCDLIHHRSGSEEQLHWPLYPQTELACPGILGCKEQKCVHIIDLLAIYHVIQSVTFLPCLTEDNDC